MQSKRDIDAAFDALYREHGGEIFRVCLLYLGDRAAAEDAAQDTFYKAYKGLHGFRRRSDIGTWLTRIAINTCKDALRKVKPIPLDDMAHEPSYTDDRDTRLTVAQAVSRLSPKLREAVILYYYRELPQKDIARLLRVSESAAAKRLERGREALREMLGDDFCG